MLKETMSYKKKETIKTCEDIECKDKRSKDIRCKASKGSKNVERNN